LSLDLRYYGKLWALRWSRNWHASCFLMYTLHYFCHLFLSRKSLEEKRIWCTCRLCPRTRMVVHVLQICLVAPLLAWVATSDGHDIRLFCLEAQKFSTWWNHFSASTIRSNLMVVLSRTPGCMEARRKWSSEAIAAKRD
jgi:hypothetical protein